jgi:hypothetical protein
MMIETDLHHREQVTFGWLAREKVLVLTDDDPGVGG